MKFRKNDKIFQETFTLMTYGLISLVCLVKANSIREGIIIFSMGSIAFLLVQIYDQKIASYILSDEHLTSNELFGKKIRYDAIGKIEVDGKNVNIIAYNVSNNITVRPKDIDGFVHALNKKIKGEK